MSYDLKRPHQVIVTKGQPPLVVQAGKVFERNTKKMVGNIKDIMKERVVGKHDYSICEDCGGTFTDKEGFQKHIYEVHRDKLLVSIQRLAPKNIKGTWSPTEEMLVDEAFKIANKEEEMQDPDPEAEPKTAPKKAWREKVK